MNHEHWKKYDDNGRMDYWVWKTKQTHRGILNNSCQLRNNEIDEVHDFDSLKTF